VLADPQGSILCDFVKNGSYGKAGSWVVEGIGEDFIPPIADLSRVTAAYSIADQESCTIARELLRKEGILGGSSTGTLVAAALRYCRAQSSPKRVVSFVCDSGNKYLSKVFNDYWMMDNGFITRPRHGDLRDLISRLHEELATVTVAPDDALATAYARMKLYDVSQLPVLRGGEVVGLIDEWDVLIAVESGPDAFQQAVSSAMSTRLETVGLATPIHALMKTFNSGHVAVVVDQGKFYGLITRMDILHHLRNRTP
jgi:cystathionine beta-synthase